MCAHPTRLAAVLRVLAAWIICALALDRMAPHPLAWALVFGFLLAFTAHVLSGHGESV